MVLLGLLSAQIGWGQGSITYVSNLEQPSSGSVSAGSDSLYGANFFTGQNSGGYLLNSIQLAMNDASGSPIGFSVVIYSGIDAHGGIFPGNIVTTLTGAGNPGVGGTYTYTPVSSLLLSPNMDYFIVVSGATTTANGAYDWSVTQTGSPGFNGYHWAGETLFAQSNDGLNWNYASGIYGQYSLDATAAPEPGTLGLLALGVSFFGLRRWNEKKSS